MLWDRSGAICGQTPHSPMEFFPRLGLSKCRARVWDRSTRRCAAPAVGRQPASHSWRTCRARRLGARARARACRHGRRGGAGDPLLAVRSRHGVFLRRDVSRCVWGMRCVKIWSRDDWELAHTFHCGVQTPAMARTMAKANSNGRLHGRFLSEPETTAGGRGDTGESQHAGDEGLLQRSPVLAIQRGELPRYL